MQSAVAAVPTSSVRLPCFPNRSYPYCAYHARHAFLIAVLLITQAEREPGAEAGKNEVILTSLSPRLDFMQQRGKLVGITAEAIPFFPSPMHEKLTDKAANIRETRLMATGS